jgi:transketolase
MRHTFVRVLTELASRDRRVVLLTGDLGFSVIEPFAEKFPDRFFNVGVAEQNMIGMATGLAEAGFLPFVYSIATFSTLRPYEFIRNGPVLHRLPVRIVGVGGGFDYGHAGPTHHALEDLGAMRLQTDLVVLSPADSDQAERALRATWDDPRPIYYRLSKDEIPSVPGLNGQFDMARVQHVRQGSDVVLFVTGHVATEVVAAAEVLSDVGIESSVVIVSCLNPTPVSALVSVLAGASLAVTVEAHVVNGRLGSMICEVVAEAGLPCRVRRCGAIHRTEFGGSERHLMDTNGLSGARLASTIRSELKGRQTVKVTL